MADFVAVIRRAVDGLSDNTPEMRVKVYERARGAVQRQLESMKPRPPETMLQRQLEKLDAAIRDVEAEYAEALPVAEEPPAEEPAVQEQPQPVEEHFAAEPEAPVEHEEPVAPHYEEPEPVRAAEEEPQAWHAPAEENRAVEEWHTAQPREVEAPPAEEPPAEEPQVEETPAAAYQPPEELHDVPEIARHEERVEPSQHVEPIHEEWPQQPQAEIQYSVDDEHHRLTEVAAEEAATLPRAEFITEPLYADGSGRLEDVWAEQAAPAVESRTEEPAHSWAPEPEVEVAPEPRIAAVDAPRPILAFSDPLADLDTPVQRPVAAKAAAEPFAWDADAFDELPPIPPAKKPAEPVALGDFDDVDLFADVHNTPAKPAPKNDVPGDGWRELKELAGYDRFGGDDQVSSTSVPPDLDAVTVSKLQGKSYRMEPKRRRFGIKGILLTLIGLAIVGGAGYAAWQNRNAINGMVAGLISSAPKTATVVDSKPATPPANTAANTPSTPAQANNGAAAKPATGNTDVASADADNTVNTKFTQRLMANGNEVDDGPAPAPSQSQVAEGKSVAQQNIAAAPVPAPAPAASAQPNVAQPAPAAPAPQPQSNAAPAATPPAGGDPAAPAQAAAAAKAATPAATGDAATAAAASQQTAPVGSEKMFLYEERIGQTSPTAIEGSVTWTLQQEKGTDGRPEPSVQGSISVPERGLTAMITFKRNSDPSLPASHLVELVFSVPPNFEGGSIDSVQRIAMKATEQDRGDPLIAVPAKITDDFHMVALNDFPDARKTNLDLLRSRDWIDIPVTYRNGRRALLTMEKGQTGTDDFNKAITAWAALGDVSSSQ
jgi:hypothetical protein